jgi:hypothetical protein
MNLEGTAWKSKTGMAPVTVVGDSSPTEGPGRWILVEGAGGRKRWITVNGLFRKFTGPCAPPEQNLSGGKSHE